MDSEAAFKNIWIPRRKPEVNGASDAPVAAADAMAAEEMEQFRQIEGQDESGDSEDDFAAALKSVSGEQRIGDLHIEETAFG